MKLDYPPFEPTSFHPCRQAGLEERTAFAVRVYWLPGEAIGEDSLKEAIALLESGARVGLDRWVESSEFSTVGLAFYLVEPTLTNSWQERKESGHRVELISSVRVVRGLLRADGHLYRRLGGQVAAGIDQGKACRLCAGRNGLHEPGCQADQRRRGGL